MDAVSFFCKLALMNMRRFSCILLLSLMLMSACRFNRSILSYRIWKRESYISDSILHKKTKRYFFLCLRTSGVTGTYKKVVQYYPSGRIEFIKITKFINPKPVDPPFNKRRYLKELNFDEHGKMNKKKLWISQMRNSGKYRIILDKTITIDSTGTKTSVKKPRSVFPHYQQHWNISR